MRWTEYLCVMKTVDNCTRSELLRKFGSTYESSIEYLLTEKYIESSYYQRHELRTVSGHLEVHTVTHHTNKYHITGYGLSFLEGRRPELVYKWGTFAIAVWGAVTGTIALLLELWPHFQ